VNDADDSLVQVDVTLSGAQLADRWTTASEDPNVIVAVDSPSVQIGPSTPSEA